ncbi:5,6-dimethylbenzimidazole synthase [Chelatococcus reniformis]|uniref:5,6-dimethylbenzimidazole synthase n=1 Tax=Chelatococcus reniformis TaxID=1494448 RepID=A0A916TX98_9HYPH|nr:5,6-dimethylbenzimidazole synthase [Chelatococcus reniformis]GGC50443.1 5,6-dimethylbenzimidazole synthase [Chelatococcus reniformis]
MYASHPVPPTFGAEFREQLDELLCWRRDVRRFRADPVDDDLLRRLLASAQHAPSVGNSQPWRFVAVDSEPLREGVRDEFQRCNAEALASYAGERAAKYATLKLEGLRQAPVHLAVFTDLATAGGHGLGRATMPETLNYSTVTAVHALWLVARAHGIGVGWVSILEPARVTALLGVPQGWDLVAYLCIGWPVEEHVDPELVRHRWQEMLSLDAVFSRI